MPVSERIDYIAYDTVTRKIMNVGRANDFASYQLQPKPAGCALAQFTGGIKGHYFVDGVMVSEPPEL